MSVKPEVSLCKANTVPVLLANAGEAAATRFLEFFAARIRSRNTCEACARFLTWCERHVAAYIEERPGAGRQRERALGCHSFRATGITIYLDKGGALENAQKIAAHESPRTIKLYDRTDNQLTLDEIERIVV